MDSYIQALDLLLTTRRSIEYVMLLRFELMFRQPLSALPLAWPRINFGFRDDDGSWDVKAVTDLW